MLVNTRILNPERLGEIDSMSMKIRKFPQTEVKTLSKARQIKLGIIINRNVNLNLWISTLEKKASADLLKKNYSETF